MNSEKPSLVHYQDIQDVTPTAEQIESWNSKNENENMKKPRVKKTISKTRNKKSKNSQQNAKKNKRKYRKSQYKQLPKGASFTMKSSNYRTQRCSYYEKGCCKKGDKCSYSHDFEVKVLDEICKFYLTGNCHKQNCVFSHDLAKYPCKFYHISMNC